jgi:hypothetical protein
MKGICKYVILEKFNLIIQFFQGEIILSDLKKIKRNLFQDKFYNQDYKILADFRLSNINLSIEDVEEYGKWIGTKLKSSSSSSYAILTSTPEQVALSSIFISNENLKKDNYRVFSTMESSLNYLHLDTSNIEIIEAKINKLKVIPSLKSNF